MEQARISNERAERNTPINHSQRELQIAEEQFTKKPVLWKEDGDVYLANNQGGGRGNWIGQKLSLTQERLVLSNHRQTFDRLR